MITRLTTRSTILIVAAFLSLESVVALRGETPPNIIVILADDLGYGDVNLGVAAGGAFANPHIKTPRLAELARTGLVFTHFYAAHATCSPSRAGLVTGRIPTRDNIHLWISATRENDRVFLPGSEVTIAEMLKGAGYDTAVIGKWHLNGADWERKENWTGWTGSFPFQQGFQFAMVTKENPYLERNLKFNSQRDPGDFFGTHGNPLGTKHGYSSQIITDAALDWLRKRGREEGRPFFLYLPYDAVHENIFNPPEYDRMYDTGIPKKDHYYANVTYLDHQIGRLLDGIDQLGLSDNTLIWFSSDNGPQPLYANPRSDECYGTSFPLRGQKAQLYEGGIRVPSIVRWPGRIAAGISTAPCSTLDYLPTFCRLAGINIPGDLKLDGTDVSAHLVKRAPIERAQPLYWQIETRRDYEVTGEGYDRRFDGHRKKQNPLTPQVVIRQGDYVLMGLHCGQEFGLPTQFELYDLTNDPEERHELSQEKPGLFKEMTGELRRLHESVNADRIRTADWVAAHNKAIRTD